MKVQFEVNGGSVVLSVIRDLASGDSPVIVDLTGTTRDGTPRVERLAEKLQKAADKVADGKNYRYALRI